MNPYKDYTLDRLLLEPLNKEVLDRILEIFGEMQRTDLGSYRETNGVISAKTAQVGSRFDE